MASQTAVATRPHRRLGRRARIAAIAALGAGAMLALTGCLDVKANVAVTDHATGTGDIAFQFDKSAAGFLGVTDLAGFSQIFAGGDSDLGQSFPASSCKATESDTLYAYTCTFADKAFTDPAGPWQITQEPDGGKITFRFASTSSGLDSMLGDGSSSALGTGSLGNVTVKVTMPSTILTAEGPGITKTSDTEATVTGELGGNYTVTITSESGASSGLGGMLPALLVVLVLLAVLVLVVIVVIVLIRRRRSPDALELESAFAAPAPGIDQAEAVDAEVVEAELIEAVEAAPALPELEAPAADAPEDSSGR